MIGKIKNFLKTFDERILSKEDDQPKMDFKGQRKRQTQGESPNPTQEQFEYNFKLDPELKPQPRKIRAKNLFWGVAFCAWYAGAVYFIMYRLKSDDLDTLEKEAEERIRLKRQIKYEMTENDANPRKR